MTTPHVASTGIRSLSGAKPVDKTLIWAGVSVVLGVTICMTVLAAMGKDTAALMTVVTVVIVPLLAALGWGKLAGIERSTENVRQQTNGNATRQLELIENLAN